MSERGSFTTQYIYNDTDYERVRNALNQQNKHLCISPPATWSNSEQIFEMPIVSGKVGALSSGTEWFSIEEAIRGVKTYAKVDVVVMCDNGNIILVTKEPNGEVSSKYLGDVNDE